MSEAISPRFTGSNSTTMNPSSYRLRARLLTWVLLVSVALVASLSAMPRCEAASGPEIDADVNATLNLFFGKVRLSRGIADKAVAILVFPTVIKAGIFGIGAEYGEGALRFRGQTAGYFNIASASVGLQLGAQARSIIFMFMTDEALANFRRNDGWNVDVEHSLAIVTIGHGGIIGGRDLGSPVLAFIFDEKGLMHSLTLEGSKISQIDR